eukprot:TRINITY_DN7641_c0_g1_i1.p1 TRINITY_DN7641_c0_g1~~TRINITY_DN7641_c0_g1_i1.p1  ORF type:complete len:349 (-),score=84.03 TRINITY_DN7641_c0_g1_i1:32-1078(-)
MTDVENSLLYVLLTKPGIDVCKLLTLQHACLPDFYKAYRSIEDKNLITKDAEGKLFITDAGREQLPAQATSQPHFSAFCDHCEGRGLAIPQPPTDLSVELNEIIKSRPSPLEKYDQWYMTADHSSFRADFIRENGDLVDKKILFIGDDDLLSVAVSLTKLPREVVVLEIDERIVDFVNELGKRLNIPLSGRVYDIRLPLDETLARQFDVFICDPTETMQGFSLFVSRGVSSLRTTGSAVYFGLTALEASKKKWYEIQKLLHSMNLVVTEIRHNFTEYPDPPWVNNLSIWTNLKTTPSCTWYKSCLYRLELIDDPNPAIVGECELEGDVYEDDESWATTSNKTEVELPK